MRALKNSKDLCYFPTKGLCHLSKTLPQGFFPDNTEGVFRQEMVTWERVDQGIKRTTHVRNFTECDHYDSRTSEIFLKESQYGKQ
jgi:hypothetical protein